ncbi:MAG TPA: hypothetical protein VEN78_15175 [Bradyrhizobium sp.]|nr:hypothetical protein [Bradyrhizobium sp.]
MKKLVIASIFVLSSCAVTPIDISNKEGACAKSCQAAHSSCMSGGMFVIFPIMTQQNCTNDLNTCVQACPDKNESARTPASTATKQSTEDKLKELKRLRDTGLISDGVYMEQQKAILGRP